MVFESQLFFESSQTYRSYHHKSFKSFRNQIILIAQLVCAFQSGFASSLPQYNFELSFISKVFNRDQVRLNGLSRDRQSF